MTNYERTNTYAIYLLDSASKLITDYNVNTVARVECFARTFCGLSFWLTKQHQDIGITFLSKGIALLGTATLNNQLLVEAAYLCLGFMRVPKFWYMLHSSYREAFLHFLNSVRHINFLNNNWCLFPAMIEAFKLMFGENGNKQTIQYALNAMENMYAGDSIYKDGAHFQMDYYNSYVIHPMIFEIVSFAKEVLKEDFGYMVYLKRAQRYAEILENLISPEGTFPIMGRSSVYRFAAFAHLSDMARRKMLPGSLDIFAVCNALTSVIDKMMLNIFDKDGKIILGLVSETSTEQEYYISEGSPYICCMGLAHLAFAKDAAFWNNPDRLWTQKKIWQTDAEVLLLGSIHL